jgi:hypothetical protein
MPPHEEANQDNFNLPVRDQTAMTGALHVSWQPLQAARNCPISLLNSSRRLLLDGQLRRITLAEDPGSARPERHFPSGAAQTRIVSVARIRLDPRKSCALSKG